MLFHVRLIHLRNFHLCQELLFVLVLLLNNIYVKTESLKIKITDFDLRNELENLQEESKYSPTKSSITVKEIENQIITLLDQITLNMEKQNKEEILSKITNCRDLLKKRNMFLKKNM